MFQTTNPKVIFGPQYLVTVIPRLYLPHLYPNLGYIPALMLDGFPLFYFHINIPQLYPTQIYPYPQFSTIPISRSYSNLLLNVPRLYPLNYIKQIYMSLYYTKHHAISIYEYLC
jgi:hypothetical protein